MAFPRRLSDVQSLSAALALLGTTWMAACNGGSGAPSSAVTAVGAQSSKGGSSASSKETNGPTSPVKDSGKGGAASTASTEKGGSSNDSSGDAVGGDPGKTSESDGGTSNSPPANGGSTTKQGNGGSTNSPSNGGTTSSPSNGGSTSAVSNGGANVAPGNGGSVNAPSNGGSATSSVANTCTSDSQCPNGHCVSNACVCWDTNQKVCNGKCTDVKYNNSNCGECGKACPSSAPRCDNGTCKCDSPPCAGGSSTPAEGGAPAGQGGSPSVTPAAGGSPASSSSTSSGSGVTLPPITNGSKGFTTRYWDCCKPSCGWAANAAGKSPVKTCGKDGTSSVGADAKNACESGGSGFMCYWGAPWSVSDTVSYGYAAYNNVACGTCYHIQFTGNGHYGPNAGSTSLKGKSMIVQVINIGGIASDQFDLLIPGGGVGAMNACTANGNQWGGIDVGAQSGGILAACNGDKSCAEKKCQSAFGDKPTLLAGCNWFTGWFGAADNPEIEFKSIACPSEITGKSGISG